MFAQKLVELRQRAGYKSARSFFQVLIESGALDCEYSYYTRVEKSKVMPSPTVVAQIANFFQNRLERESLIKAYCSEQFKSYSHLFTSEKLELSANEGSIAVSTQSLTIERQKVLSMKQVECITRSRTHYFCYLVIILARRPILLNELSKLLGDVNSASTRTAVRELKEARVFFESPDGIDSFCKETLFPARKSQSVLDDIYQKLDGWDAEFGKTVKLQQLNRKTYIRRISPRNVPIIQNIAAAAVQLIEAGDDSDRERNSVVIHFSQSISVGELLG